MLTSRSKKNLFHHKPEQGFTLVESLVYMLLLSVLLVVLTDLLTSVLRVQARSQSYSNVEDEARYLMTRVLYDVNRASVVTTPGTLGQSTPTLQMTIGGSTYTYGLSSGNVILTTGSSATLNTNTVTVSALAFQRVGNVGGKPTLRISMTIQSLVAIQGTPQTKSYQTTVGLR